MSEVPCLTCIVYAACRAKSHVTCTILYDHFNRYFPDRWSTGSRAAIIAEIQMLNKYVEALGKFEYAIFNVKRQITIYD